MWSGILWWQRLLMHMIKIRKLHTSHSGALERIALHED
jgi:hypothetical protein